MTPPWAIVVGALSLAVIALSALAVAVSAIASALAVREFLRMMRLVAGPAVDDVRMLVGNIRREADALVGTSRDVRLKIVKAVDAAETRLEDLHALVDVVQHEVENTALDAAATLRGVRRGLSVWRWGKKLIRGRRRR